MTTALISSTNSSLIGVVILSSKRDTVHDTVTNLSLQLVRVHRCGRGCQLIVRPGTKLRRRETLPTDRRPIDDPLTIMRHRRAPCRCMTSSSAYLFFARHGECWEKDRAHARCACGLFCGARLNDKDQAINCSGRLNE